MADIETRLFRYFVALAHEQHFARAAASLEISPPTLTNQIQKLEARLGAKLVERGGNTHVERTAAGKRFLDRARNVLREADEAVAVAREAARGETGRLEIGFMTVAAMAGLIERFIGGFQRANPGIEIILHQMITLEQIGAILSKDLDFGFVLSPQRYPSGLQGFVIYGQPMVLALPSDHPLARQKKIEPAALKGESFINTGPEVRRIPEAHGCDRDAGRLYPEGRTARQGHGHGPFVRICRPGRRRRIAGIQETGASQRGLSRIRIGDAAGLADRVHLPPRRVLAGRPRIDQIRAASQPDELNEHQEPSVPATSDTIIVQRAPTSSAARLTFSPFRAQARHDVAFQNAA
jgi:DNA-binding transcriptional LysR family regulator